MIAPRIRVAVTVAALVVTAAPTAAVAEPVDPGEARPGTTTQAEVDAAKRAVAAGQADVEEAQRELDAARDRVEALYEAAAIASEKANAAREELTRKTAEAATARAEADAAADAAVRSQESLEQMAAQLYMRGGPMADLMVLFAGSTGDLAREEADLSAAKGYRADHLTDARRAKTTADTARAKAESAQKAQQKAATEAAAALADAQKAVATAEKEAQALAVEEKRLVGRLAELRRTSVEIEQRRQEQLRREAAEREAARVRADTARVAAEAAAQRAAGAPTDVPAPADLPAPDTAAAATAIDWARQQLGKPYLWGGNGPDAFDCSGLMVGSWRAAGKSLPRTAQWQYDATTRVPIADLKPGDLVFFGRTASSIYHVGMYVGNGRMIEAPRTGLDLRYSSIYRSSLLPYGGRV